MQYRKNGEESQDTFWGMCRIFIEILENQCIVKK